MIKQGSTLVVVTEGVSCGRFSGQLEDRERSGTEGREHRQELATPKS